MQNICERAIAYIKAPVSENGLSLVLPEQESPVIRIINGDIISAYLIEDGEKFLYVQNKDLSSQSVSLEAFHEAAVANLESRARKSMRVQPYGSIYVIFMDGNFEASLLLSDSLWENGFAGLVQNGFAVAAPARDILAFCDSKSLEGIAELRAVISRVKEGDHLLFNEVLFRAGSQWQKNAAA